MRVPFLLVTALLAAAAACSSPAQPVQDEGLIAQSVPPALALTNRTAEPLFFTVFEREYTARILWAPCLDPATSPRIDGRARITVPYAAIGGFEPGKKEAVVYWWRLVPARDGAFKADSMRALAVTL